MPLHEAQVDPVRGAPVGFKCTQVYPTTFDVVGHVVPTLIGSHLTRSTNMGLTCAALRPVAPRASHWNTTRGSSSVK
jgi:hypothetical protein